MPNSFENNAVQIAYNNIHNFFDVFGLEHSISCTDSILKAATSKKIWNKEVPSSLLFYIDSFKSLCAAAFSIHCSYGNREKAVIVEPDDGVPDISLTQNFTNDSNKAKIWWEFPRHLIACQYHNPYKAIKKFCNYMAEPEWNNYLKDVTEYALNKDTLDDLFHPYNILTVRLRMMQLIEACYLIDIRTNRKKIKSQKNKEKKK